jgi:hypothetical protein
MPIAVAAALVAAAPAGAQDPAPAPPPDPAQPLVADAAAPRLTETFVIEQMRSRVRVVVVRFTVSEPAAITIRVQRARPGRFVDAVRIDCSALAGRQGVDLPPRFGARDGRYRVFVSAVDAAGNAAHGAARRFSVVS